MWCKQGHVILIVNPTTDKNVKVINELCRVHGCAAHIDALLSLRCIWPILTTLMHVDTF